MKSITLFVSFLSFCLLSACTTSDFKETQSLKPDEGLILTECASGWGNMLNVYESGYDTTKFFRHISESAVIIPCPKQDKLSLLKLKEGDYFIGSVGVTVYQPQSQALNFTIEPNKINYIGDLKYGSTLKTLDTHKTRTFTISISDNFKETKEAFEKSMPNIAERYEVISRVAKVPSSQKE